MSEAEELRRVLPVVRGLAEEGAVVSVDTMRASVAARAVAAGAVLVNDVSGGLADPEMVPAVAETEVPFVVMHWRGQSIDMNNRAVYTDVVGEVIAELRDAVDRAVGGGIAPARIVADPGLGFAKRAEHDLTLVAALARLRTELGRPLLVAASRKRFLGRVLADGAAPRRRLPANATRRQRPSRHSRPARAPGPSASTRYGPAPTRSAWCTPSRRRPARRVPAHPPALGTPRATDTEEPGEQRRGHDIEAVEAANTALYDAVEHADLDALTGLWMEDGISVVHPGWPALTGREEVLRSYALIMANTDYVQFFLTDVESPCTATPPW